jgi:choice-of-anchor B domain-containing protein
MTKYILVLLAASLNIGIITAQTTNLELLGHLSYPNQTLAGCWHCVDSLGNEYGLIGTSAGMSIVDLNDPTQPQEIFTIPGLQNNWRELKTWNGFAYVGSEAQGSGITIVDLRNLPDTVYYQVWKGDAAHENQILSSHTVSIDNGFLYINGGSSITNGVVICDLADPWNPLIIGAYSDSYAHDTYVRGDTMWVSTIYKEGFEVVDITDKTNPVFLESNPTPGQFNHNTWLSDDGKTLFAADEKANAPLASFDVSDLNDIKLLDTYFCSQFPSKEVHNVRVLGDFLINPSYGGQLTLVDATHPDNLIETAIVSLGSSLVWDADPYLPSGIIMATAKAEGLFIYKPTYQQAAYLQGTVIDTILEQKLAGVTLKVIATPNTAISKSDGTFKTGAAQAGIYSVVAEKAGYVPVTIENISLQSGQITEIEVFMSTPVATEDIAKKERILVSPTVFNQCITIDVSQGSLFSKKGTCITVADMFGRIVLESSFSGDKTEICTNNDLPAGQYLLFLQNEQGQSLPQRIIKS